MSFQLIGHAIFKITVRDNTVLIYEFAPKQPKKEHKLGLKNFLHKLSTSGDGPEKAQKQRRDKNTRRLSCCTKVMVKKAWNTTLLLLPDYATDTE